MQKIWDFPKAALDAIQRSILEGFDSKAALATVLASLNTLFGFGDSRVKLVLDILVAVYVLGEAVRHFAEAYKASHTPSIPTPPATPGVPTP